jgi:hypothetical protein
MSRDITKSAGTTPSSPPTVNHHGSVTQRDRKGNLVSCSSSVGAVRRAGDLPHRYGKSTRKPQSSNSQNGSATWIYQVSTDQSWPIGLRGGLIRLLALIVGVALLFTARHPTGLFTLIDDTADYPPLRLDTRGG